MTGWLAVSCCYRQGGPCQSGLARAEAPGEPDDRGARPGLRPQHCFECAAERVSRRHRRTLVGQGHGGALRHGASCVHRSPARRLPHEEHPRRTSAVSGGIPSDAIAAAPLRERRGSRRLRLQPAGIRDDPPVGATPRPRRPRAGRALRRGPPRPPPPRARMRPPMRRRARCSPGRAAPRRPR